MTNVTENYHVVLASRPGANVPASENFAYKECPHPQGLQQGDILIKTCYLSVAPAMRCQMEEDTGADYMQPWPIGETVNGLAGIGVVLQSKHPNFSPGDLVQSLIGWPWKLYYTRRGEDNTDYFSKVDDSLKQMLNDHTSLLLSYFGLEGLTALLGIWVKGHVRAGGHQTAVVSGAAGACGSLAGQFLRLEGCERVVGVCGTDEKCRWLVEELGYDAAINYKTDNVRQKLHQHCPDGIDVYFDNVGGFITNTVIKQMNKNSHVILCGAISGYNDSVVYPPMLPQDIQQFMHNNIITRERFTVTNYPDMYAKGMKTLSEWWLADKVKVRETIAEGLEHAGAAFVSMMTGGNIGKQIVHVADPSV